MHLILNDSFKFKIVLTWWMGKVPMDDREGSPPGISIKSLSYIKMFSDSALKKEMQFVF